MSDDSFYASEGSDTENEKQNFNVQSALQSTDVSGPDKRVEAEGEPDRNMYDEDGEGDLAKAMESVFADGAFSFAGDIAHVAAREDAPNPCLLIDGIGTVGVPLSNREAGILWTQASPVTSEGVLLKNVWSIKGSKIGLQSKTWVSWLDKLVLQVARDELGIWAPENHKLQCSLTELYLCGMGANTIPWARTLPANAVATVSVLLPSLYEGGKLAFCHEDRSKCADLANFSATKTIVLVAHTNVIAHMSEVTNGLRLALSYDLLCTNDGQLVNKSVCPMLPSMISATVALDKVLNQWNRGRYKRESIQDPPLFALALPQELPGDVCSLGTSGLSGGNARAVSYLASSADDLGFVLALATFVACMAGFDALKRMLERVPASKLGPRCLALVAAGQHASGTIVPDGEDPSVCTRALIEKCLQEAVGTLPSTGNWHRSDAEDAVQVVKACLKVDFLKPYRSVLARILDNIDKADEFQLHLGTSGTEVFLSGVCESLSEHGMNPSSQPFRGVFQALLRIYLTRYLGSKPPYSFNPPVEREVGCTDEDCELCSELRHFFRVYGSATLSFDEPQRARAHIEAQLNKACASDVCTVETLETGSGRKPHTLVIEKKPGVKEMAEWERRVENMKGMLHAIGDAQTQKTFWGESEYRAIQDALKGLKAYRIPSKRQANTSTRKGDRGPSLPTQQTNPAEKGKVGKGSGTHKRPSSRAGEGPSAKRIRRIVSSDDELDESSGADA